MKQRVSLTLEKETLELVEEALKSKKYRNRSHAIEFILNEALNNDGGGE